MSEDAGQEDLISPVAIRHLVEFGDPNPDVPGQFGYWYNFIYYEFDIGGRVLRARHYLDEPGTVVLLSSVPEDDEASLKVLVFLLLRYDKLKWLGAEGQYVALPEPVMVNVRRRRDLYLAQDGN